VFHELLSDVLTKSFQGVQPEDLCAKPYVYTSFTATADGAYRPIPSYERLKQVLETKIREYNENNAMIDLVLFEQAILHITRISRVIQNPG